MGRISELLGEIAENAEEGGEGLVLSADAWDRLRDDWTDEEIDAITEYVKENIGSQG